MSTHAIIGIQGEDGAVKSIYCQWSGQPYYTGKVLLKHFAGFGKLAQLFEQGDIWTLGAEIGEKHDASKSVPHTADGIDVVCSFFYRDGESDWALCRPRFSKTVRGFLTQGRNCFAEYAYLLTSQGWVLYTDCKGKPVPLADAVTLAEAERAAKQAAIDAEFAPAGATA